MKTTFFVVQTNAVPGREDEFNDWYDNQHIGDVLALDGFSSAQRFIRSDIQRTVEATRYPFQHLALYEVAGDTRAAIDELGAAVANGMYLSPAMVPERQSIMFDAITDRITG